MSTETRAWYDDTDGETPDGTAEVNRTVGCPGGGKSTRLINKVREHAREGMEPYDMYYLTFTNSGRSEVADRLVTAFDGGDEDEIKDRAKTFHGLACSVCCAAGIIENTNEQVALPGSEVHEEFCARYGLSYDADEDDPLIAKREGTETTHAGNQLFGLAEWLRYTQNPPEACAQSPENIQLPAPYPRTVELLKAWERFKREEYELPQYEHADYVDEAIECGLASDLDVLFIDEFQDLCPQEYLLYLTWQQSGEIEMIYIAGDPNQSIYGFRAGTPRYFIGTTVDETVTRMKSYRCPSNIVDVAAGVLEAHPDTDPNGFTAAKQGGTAERVRLPYGPDLAGSIRGDLDAHNENEDGNTVFVLTRTNKQARSVASTFDGEGVPYAFLGREDDKQPWGDGLSLAYRALETVANGQKLQHKPSEIRGALKDRLTETATEKSVDEINDMQVAALLREMDLHYPEHKRFESALKAGAWTQPAKVKVGTMHGAKGLEAPCVYLFDSMTHSLYQKYVESENAAEEHRLYYVGATRASETLRVVTGHEGLGTEVFPPFADGLPGGESR